MNDSTEARRAQPVRMPGDATGDDGWIPLVRFAHQHGWTWSRAYNMALSGKLEARQTETGRWFVREPEQSREG